VLVKAFPAVGGDYLALKQTLEHFNHYSQVCSTFLLALLQYVAILF